ncbi:MAG: SCP2 sterol-binding domain-containing protein [Lachnospiraceae bacterium]|nr:SCP2 sterol-binding domain-containing protein [Lachnospiraceae bacterium]
MKYEEIVAKVKKAYAKADTSKVNGHLAVQVDVTGEGEGAFYIEVADGKITVAPFEYYDHDFKVLCAAEEIIAIAEGKKKLGAEVDAGNAYVSRDIEKVAVFDSIVIKKAAAKKTAEKKTVEKKEAAPKAEKKAAAPKAEKKAAAPKAEKKAAAPKAEKKAAAPKAEKKVAAPKAEKKAAAPKAEKKAAAPKAEKKAAAPKAAKKVMTEAEKKAEEEIKKAASKIAALATPKKK